MGGQAWLRPSSEAYSPGVADRRRLPRRGGDFLDRQFFTMTPPTPRTGPDARQCPRPACETLLLPCIRTHSSVTGDIRGITVRLHGDSSLMDRSANAQNLMSWPGCAP